MLNFGDLDLELFCNVSCECDLHPCISRIAAVSPLPERHGGIHSRITQALPSQSFLGFSSAQIDAINVLACWPEHRQTNRNLAKFCQLLATCFPDRRQ